MTPSPRATARLHIPRSTRFRVARIFTTARARIRSPLLAYRDHMGTDVKITGEALLDDHLGAAIICGPTYDQQPVFDWKTLDPMDHEDFPERYDFPFYIARMDIDGEMDFDYTPFKHLNCFVC